MANLQLIGSLHQKYGNEQSRLARYSRQLNEGFNLGKDRKTLNFSLQNIEPSFVPYFKEGVSTEVVLLYIDVCDFSTRFSSLSGKDIGNYFDQYYDIIIPTIQEYGGEIDKIMGDGIICVFGAPFRKVSIQQNTKSGYDCAKEIIKKTRNTKYSSKVAIHRGEINYFENKTGLYEEYTMIGKPLTELFRLESISKGETINYYSELEMKNQSERDFDSPRIVAPPLRSNSILTMAYDSPIPPQLRKINNYERRKEIWEETKTKIENLKGVDFKSHSALQLTYKY